MMTHLYSLAQIRTIEQALHITLPSPVLLRRAGEAAAHAAIHLLNASQSKGPTTNVPVLIAAGPGNNGRDAFACGALLARQGYAVTFLAPMLSADHPDASDLYALAQSGHLGFTEHGCLDMPDRQHWRLIIDGLFGIGLSRPLTGIWRSIIDTLNNLDAPRLALDVPSGLNADTGTVLASPDDVRTCMNATHTLTFLANKPGLYTGDGRDHAGIITLAGLGIARERYPAPQASLNRPALFAASTHRRRQNSHKGSFGDVQIIGGANGMVGAAILAAHAALKAGSGRVMIGFVDPLHKLSYVAGHPEVMCRLADELDFSDATLVVGPGLGLTTAAQDLVGRACLSDAPLVLDADGLNLVSTSATLGQQLSDRGVRLSPTLLTPHPLEAARLLGIPVAQVQADRVRAAVALAGRYHATVILKGSGTVIVHDSSVTINPTGNPALAAGGTGDVLAGLCGALLAQGWSAHDAARAAVWIHGMAADQLVSQGTGPVGVSASELIDAIRSVLNAQMYNSGRPGDGCPG